MMKRIALDWDSHELRMVIANAQGTTTQIESAQVFSLATSQPSDATDSATTEADSPDETVKASSSELPAAFMEAFSVADVRTRGAEILVSVRRSDVELRVIKLPPLPETELPDIVRMQALREFSELSDSWPLDFLTLHADDEETTVLAAAIAPKKMARYEQPFETAQLKPHRMILRPTATAHLLGALDAQPRPDVEVCIENTGHAFEMSVLREGMPILIRTVHASGEDAEQQGIELATQIRRTTMAAHGNLNGHAVGRVVMLGGVGNEDLARVVEREINLPVELLDPFSVTPLSSSFRRPADGESGQFAAAIGMLVAAATSEDDELSAVIDFLNPRKAPPPKSNKNLVLAGVTCSLLAMFLGAGGFMWYLSSLDEDVRQLQLRIQKRKDLMAAAQSRLDEVNSINRWMDSRVNWMELMTDVSVRLPDAEHVRVERWQADLLANGNGQLILEGIADQQSTIADVDIALQKSDRRVVGAGGEFEDRDPELPWRFKQTVTLETTAGKQPAPRRTRRR